MKAVILAGGFGTRLAEETEVRPKPMVEIGGQPILWHIMKHYAHHGVDEFMVALGHKGEHIKHFFLDRARAAGSLTVDLRNGDVRPWERPHEDWTVHLVDTGTDAMTGGRLLALRPQLEQGTFMLTYGDGVSDVDVQALLAFHKSRGRIATLTAVRPPARFGALTFDGDLIPHFTEKPQAGEGWINGGFMVFEPAVFEYLDGPHTILEAHALERLAAVGQLAAYRHEAFWQCMDTLRDKRYLEPLWAEQRAPWKVWE